ncbi:MAG: hypothetical protein ABW107_06590 [Candidatus Thiodiazotropha sp. 6PLUC5]
MKLVKNFLSSSFQRRRFIEQALFSLLLGGVSLGALLAALNLSGALEGQQYYWLAGLSYLLPLVVFLLIRSLRDTPRIP